MFCATSIEAGESDDDRASQPCTFQIVIPNPIQPVPAPTAKKTPVFRIVSGATFLLLALIGAFFLLRFSLTIWDFLGDKEVAADGEVELSQGTWFIYGPDLEEAQQFVITDETGQQIDVGSDYVHGGPKFYVEKSGNVSFDTDGQPIEVGRESGYIIVLMIAALIGWAIVGVMGIIGASLLLSIIFTHSRQARS